MQFRKVLIAASAALFSVFVVNAANAATVRVDLLTGDTPATNTTPAFQNAYVGTTVHFGPGTYVVTYATGGNYQAYDQCGVAACAGTDPGYQDGFAIYTHGPASTACYIL